MRRSNKPAPEAIEDTEGHMPRLSGRAPEAIEDTEGHMPRMRSYEKPAPDTVDEDTEGRARNRP